MTVPVQAFLGVVIERSAKLRQPASLPLTPKSPSSPFMSGLRIVRDPDALSVSEALG